MKGSTSAQQAAASCRSQRAWAVPATTESRPMHVVNSVLAALPLPRHGESAAADLTASHTGLSIAAPSIEGVRTHAFAISIGALAVFRAFSTPSPAPPRRPVVGSSRTLRSFVCSKTLLKLIYANLLRACPALFRRALDLMVESRPQIISIFIMRYCWNLVLCAF
jgi:hypothetical protein